MELPQALREAIELHLGERRSGQLLEDAQAISLRYRTQIGTGVRLVTRENEAAAYAAARMPATFGAVYSALQQTLALTGFHPETLLDAGAGTGAASWAADDLLQLKNVICVEREKAMLETGKAIMKHGPAVLREAEWRLQDISGDEPLEKAELVIAAYVLNEMTGQSRLKTAEKLWKATTGILLLVEPGTPVAFSALLEVRKNLLQAGAHIVAPCPLQECPKTAEDWCHFTCRIARSRLHRQLKGGEAPFEDEKFSYIALTAKPVSSAGPRVLRHPQVRSGHVFLEVCTEQGIQNLKLSKKDGEAYRVAKKAKAGDTL